ncbi:MAG: hypothetical protein A2X35_08145 [Elusimicrobia bacterium GWA2_61_42]|nr:MAG: hypothetical protein A2X35_08145 [Elusimicrobia bacterium GWA2_61_42]OGR79951.1 MAG: hypothetical protein A2X38_02030 [Elusimicrobia bacterium GWC2_61_25]
MIEKGIKISGLSPARLEAGGALKDALEKFDWFYIGEEFCENLLPAPAELKRTAAFFLEKGRKVCVLTPPVSERGIKNLKSAFRLLSRLDPDAVELTVNDFGALELARECGLRVKINAGRLLYGNLFMVRRSTLRLINPQALRFFTSRGINRFELSATGERPRTDFGGAGSGELNLTLYYPYLNMTTTRTCLLGVPDIPPHESAAGINCRRECAVASFEVKHPLIKESLLVRGNTVFMRFPRKFYSSEKSLEAMRVNRLVYCPFP